SYHTDAIVPEFAQPQRQPRSIGAEWCSLSEAGRSLHPQLWNLPLPPTKPAGIPHLRTSACRVPSCKGDGSPFLAVLETRAPRISRPCHPCPLLAASVR